MTSRSGSVQPPRVATWLLNLFASADEAETILGDLLEEFSHLASKSEVAVARRWYWRQSVKTAVHLFATGFRAAPWSTAAAAIGGYFLSEFVSGLPDKVLSAVTDRYLGYWSAHFQAYMWLLNGMLITHIFLSILVGCVVALAAKGREMVATMTLALVLGALTGVAFAWVAAHQAMADTIPWMLWQCAGPLAIVSGGAIVRMRRTAAITLPSGT